MRKVTGDILNWVYIGITLLLCVAVDLIKLPLTLLMIILGLLFFKYEMIYKGSRNGWLGWLADIFEITAMAIKRFNE